MDTLPGCLQIAETNEVKYLLFPLVSKMTAYGYPEKLNSSIILFMVAS